MQYDKYCKEIYLIDSTNSRDIFKMENIERYIDIYSEDIFFLREAKRNALNNPLNLNSSALNSSQKQAAACRLFIVHMISSVDFMIRAWREKDNLKILENYFNSESNGDKIESLKIAFHKNGIRVDEEIFKDYLAIKFLRNIITHQNPRKQEIYWIENRGFPIDFALFNETHWEKLQNIEQNMLYYLFLPTVLNAPLHNDKNSKTIKFYESKNELEGKIITIKSFEELSIKNLVEIQSVYEEKISEYIKQETKLNVLKINTGNADLVYSTIANAGIESHRFFKELPYLFDIAIFNWEIIQKKIDKLLNLNELMNDINYVNLLRTDLDNLMNENSLNEILLFKELLHNKNFLNNLGKKFQYRENEIPLVLNTIHKAFICYEIFCEIDVLKLFGLYLPLIVPTKRNASINIGMNLFNIFQLNVFYKKLFNKNFNDESHIDYFNLYQKSINGTWWKK